MTQSAHAGGQAECHLTMDPSRGKISDRDGRARAANYRAMLLGSDSEFRSQEIWNELSPNASGLKDSCQLVTTVAGAMVSSPVCSLPPGVTQDICSSCGLVHSSRGDWGHVYETITQESVKSYAARECQLVGKAQQPFRDGQPQTRTR